MHSGFQPLLDRCLGPLVMHLDRTQLAYRSYLESDRNFRGAIVLWRANNDLSRHLLETAWMLPEDLKWHATKIINHIDVWASLWEHHRDQQLPQLDDEFVFPNEHQFPKDSEAELRNHFVALKKQSD